VKVGAVVSEPLWPRRSARIPPSPTYATSLLKRCPHQGGRLREVARGHGFDAVGVTRPADASGQAKVFRTLSSPKASTADELARRDCRVAYDPHSAYGRARSVHYAGAETTDRTPIRSLFLAAAKRSRFRSTRGDDYHD